MMFKLGEGVEHKPRYIQLQPMSKYQRSRSNDHNVSKTIRW